MAYARETASPGMLGTSVVEQVCCDLRCLWKGFHGCLLSSPAVLGEMNGYFVVSALERDDVE